MILSGGWSKVHGERPLPPFGASFRARVGAPGDFRGEARAIWSYLHAALVRPLRLTLEPAREPWEERATERWLSSFPDLAPMDHRCVRSTIGLPTSGTTGEPRPVERDVAAAFEATRAGDPAARWLLAYAPYRWAGLSVLLHVARSGAAVVVPDSLDGRDLVAVGRAAEVSHVSFTPSLLRRLRLDVGAAELARLPLRQVTFGGESATQSILDAARDLWPDARVTHVYATTELGDVCAVSDGRAGIPRRKLERPGFRFDADGELLVRERSTGDRWVLRGDRYHFVGRREEILDVGGAAVSLVGVEAAALAVEGVVEARAYGEPSALLGHVVALDFAGDVDERALRRALRQSLPRPACPAALRRVSAIELNSAYKTRRGQTLHGRLP